MRAQNANYNKNALVIIFANCTCSSSVDRHWLHHILKLASVHQYYILAHCCAIFLGHLGIDTEIQISISEKSSGLAINYSTTRFY